MSNESLKPFPTPAVLGELEHVNRELDFVKMLRVKQENQPLDDIEIRAAALSLSTIYNGIEKVIIFVLKSLGSEIPSGRNWHSVLLKEAENRMIISKETRPDFERFMAFRHFIRHAYSYEINPAMIKKILNTCPALVESFNRHIRKLLG